MDFIDLPLQRQLVGLIFGGICILGIIAGVFPSTYSIHLFRRRQNSRFYSRKTNKGIRTVKLEGHHPTCRSFSGHIIHLGTRTFCSGCMGMVIGAIIALFGGIWYFITEPYLIGARIILWVGFLWVTCGLLHYTLFEIRNGVTRVILNVLFVLGTFCLLVSTDILADSYIVDLYLLALILYWITIRILFSQLKHREICLSCDLKSCNVQRNLKTRSKYIPILN